MGLPHAIIASWPGHLVKAFNEADIKGCLREASLLSTAQGCTIFICSSCYSVTSDFPCTHHTLFFSSLIKFSGSRVYMREREREFF